MNTGGYRYVRFLVLAFVAVLLASGCSDAGGDEASDEPAEDVDEYPDRVVGPIELEGALPDVSELPGEWENTRQDAEEVEISGQWLSSGHYSMSQEATTSWDRATEGWDEVYSDFLDERSEDLAGDDELRECLVAVERRRDDFVQARDQYQQAVEQQSWVQSEVNARYETEDNKEISVTLTSAPTLLTASVNVFNDLQVACVGVEPDESVSGVGADSAEIVETDDWDGVQYTTVDHPSSRDGGHVILEGEYNSLHRVSVLVRVPEPEDVDEAADIAVDVHTRVKENLAQLDGND